MTYAELGAMLRDEREKRHLTIADAANELKISSRQLQALEEGNMDSLPHKAYAKGFIKSYAAWLGIGSEEIQQILSSLGLKENTVAQPAELAVEPVRRSGRKYFWPVALLLIALGLYFGWQQGTFDYLTRLGMDSMGKAPELQNAEEFIAKRDEAKRARSAETEKGAETASQPVQTAPPVTAAAEPPSPEPAEKPEPAPAAEAGNVAGQNKLIIIATEECWIHSNADKTDTRQFSLRKGDTFALTFAKSLELKLGNAGGVRLRYNGEDLPPPGTSGQVKTLTFPPANPS